MKASFLLVMAEKAFCPSFTQTENFIDAERENEAFPKVYSVNKHICETLC